MAEYKTITSDTNLDEYCQEVYGDAKYYEIEGELGKIKIDLQQKTMNMWETDHYDRDNTSISPNSETFYQVTILNVDKDKKPKKV